MSRKTRIGRRITKTHCNTLYVDSENNTHEDDVVLYGNYDVKTAQNAVRRKLDNPRVLVQDVWKESFYASMPVDVFLEHADKRTQSERID